jgi:hypothetical protein
MGHRRRCHPRKRDEEGHACPTKETLNVALVWLVPRVRLISENINSGHLTYHLENPRRY